MAHFVQGKGKNVALAGAALIILFIYDAYGDDAPASLTGPLLS